jgi:oligopeptide/dipeptide ABC transporter ATP-binding protein
MIENGALLDVERLAAEFRVPGGTLRAVDGVSFTLDRGETFALVGESGSGKSTVARAILRLVEPSGGTVRFRGRDLAHAGRRELRALRRELQIVFQDPYSSLDPRQRVGAILSEPYEIHGIGTRAERRDLVTTLLDRVGLDAESSSRFPREFSGGQRQRIAIARALALDPLVLVCDEPVSALDVSIQAQILNLLQDLQDERGLAYLFISHDLSVVREIADRVAVMYLGRIVETGDCDQFFAAPKHPYSVALISAVPHPEPAVARDQKRIVLQGDLPSPLEPPSGCRFRTRCWKAQQLCSDVDPPLVPRGDGGTFAACHFPENS